MDAKVHTNLVEFLLRDVWLLFRVQTPLVAVLDFFDYYNYTQKYTYLYHV